MKTRVALRVTACPCDVRFTPKADTCSALTHVRFVPIADIFAASTYDLWAQEIARSLFALSA